VNVADGVAFDIYPSEIHKRMLHRHFLRDFRGHFVIRASLEKTGIGSNAWRSVAEQVEDLCSACFLYIHRNNLRENHWGLHSTFKS
jgi:hypothetical protein